MRDLPASAEQYRRQPDETTHKAKLRSKDEKLIFEANTVPIQTILKDQFGIVVPDHLARSWKTNCPFGFEHPDGGVEKAMRVYPTNTAYCFSMHGIFTPVRLVQVATDKRATTAARSIAEKYGLNVNEPYWEKASRLISERAEGKRSVAFSSNAVAALQLALARVPAYEQRQFDPDIAEVMEEQLEALDVAMRSQQAGAVRNWLRSAETAVRATLSVE